MDYRLYAILTISEAEKIDFTQIKETSIETLRKSIDGLITFIEFDCDDISEFIEPLDVIKVVTYNELCQILETSQWSELITYE